MDALRKNVEALGTENAGIKEVHESLTAENNTLKETTRGLTEENARLREESETLAQAKAALEAEIAAARQQAEQLAARAEAMRNYYVTKMMVTDAAGTQSVAVAECVLQGDDGAFVYRTVDGAHVGSFERKPETEGGAWGYRENLDDAARAQVEQLIAGARPADYEARLNALADAAPAQPAPPGDGG